MGSGGQRSVKSRSVGGGTSAGSGGAVLSSTANANQATGGGSISVSSFASMSTDEQFNLIQQSVKGKAVGSYYTWDTDYQRFINNSGLDGAPNLVDDSALDGIDGTETFRTVDPNRAFPGKAIAVKTQTDDKLLYNAGGNEWFGKGLYSATDVRDSLPYGNTGDAAVMRFKIDNSKIASTSVVDMWEFKDRRNKSSLSYKLKQAGYDDGTRRAMVALSKGYIAIDNENGYITLLTRKGLNMSKSIKKKGIGSTGSKSWNTLKDYK